jgi:hypothetical protein
MIAIAIASFASFGFPPARADVTVADTYFSEIIQCGRTHSERTQSDGKCVYRFKQCVGYHGTWRSASDVETKDVGLRITCAQKDDGTCPGATFCAKDTSVASEGTPFLNGEAACGGDADAHPGCHWVHRQSEQK